MRRLGGALAICSCELDAIAAIEVEALHLPAQLHAFLSISQAHKACSKASFLSDHSSSQKTMKTLFIVAFKRGCSLFISPRDFQRTKQTKRVDDFRLFPACCKGIGSDIEQSNAHWAFASGELKVQVSYFCAGSLSSRKGEPFQAAKGVQPAPIFHGDLLGIFELPSRPPV